MSWRSSPAMEHARHKQERFASFLARIEGRAFRIAQFATGNRDDALEVVQEAMMRLAQYYSDKSEKEWGVLFYRILQSRIRDLKRRQAVRNRFRTWFIRQNDEEAEDPLAQVPAMQASEPSLQLENQQFMARLNEELGALPYRQQQVFLLRVWEGLDIAQTAAAMGCSESSVKTHFARAMKRLQTSLEDYR